MSIKDNLDIIHKRMAKALAKSAEPERALELLVVSKQRSLEEIQLVYDAGARLFGENRVQELTLKLDSSWPEDLAWHYIGPLQTNKVRHIVGEVELIHSLDRERLAKEISKRAQNHGIDVRALLQVNMAAEEQKQGFAPEDVLPFLESMESFPGLFVDGLMFMAPNTEDKEEVRPYFRQMKELFDTIAESSLPQVRMQHLSMGMSGDYPIAIEEGATIVRIGSAVFIDAERK